MFRHIKRIGGTYPVRPHSSRSAIIAATETLSVYRSARIEVPAMQFKDVVTDPTQFRELMGEPPPPCVAKTLATIDRRCRAFIGRSPFVLIASASARGQMDISPKGDAPGFVRVLDDKTLAVPDRPGNRRADTFTNVLENPRVGLIFLVPGKSETLRISGRALIVRDLAPALIVDGGLAGEVFGGRNIELAVEDRVAGGVFVDVGGAVADPLAGDEDRQFDVEFDFAHLKRCRVVVAHQVADQAFVVLDGFGAFAIADAGGLADGGVITHVVDKADMAVVKDLVGRVQVLLGPG
jgi:predicted pyridoxine 5'-phosphate oxidase superfamily flavin-nucleotide-binding protein